MEEKWRILEFYSGIGGMRYSLLRAGINGEVVQAFDINDTANDVYELNFGHRPFQGNIQSLTAFELDKYGADAWLLSPPCQPYTRQGLQKHSADARALSFIKILELITQMLLPPKLLFVENVVGFETSDTHKQMLEIFGRIGFVTQEYILSPLQFGIPYSRPRYFCLAKRRPLSFQNPSYDNKLLLTTYPLISLENVKSMDGHLVQDHEEEESHISCQPIKNFLEVETFFNHRGGLGSFPANSESNIDSEDGIDDTSGITDKNVDETEKSGVDKSPLDNYSVPQSLIERWGNVMDIVFPQSKRCCCFTKSYYRYVKGTGSLLATSEICKYESLQKLDICSLKHLGLRYFTPREVANLHSFPEDFRFPPNISIRQQYALLGNSLSVAVVASLFRYMFSPPTS